MIVKQKKLIILLVILIVNFTTNTAIAQTERLKNFLQAEHAIRTNNTASGEKLFLKLKTTPLYEYLEYQKLKKEILNNKNKQSIFYSEPIMLTDILEYRAAYPDNPLSDKLLHFWLDHTAQQQHWDNFLEAFMSARIFKPSLSLQCHNLYAQYQTQPHYKTLEPALALWMNTHEHPDGCASLFTLLHQKKIITSEQLFEKHQYLLEKKTKSALNLAKTLRTKMLPEHKQAAELLETLITHPNELNNKNIVDQLKHAKNKIIVSSFKQYAKINAHHAKITFEKNVSNLKLTAFEKGDIIKNIAFYLAYQHDSEAALWLKKIPDPNLDNKAREWRIRIALKEKNWKQALLYINQLEPPQAQEDVWQYWKARTLESLKLTGYKLIYKKLSFERSYYGFLASEKVEKPINLKDHPHSHQPKMLEQLENRAAIQRIQDLLTLGRTVDANREWYYLIAPMNAIEKTHAARLADKLKWHHWAIHTFNQSEHKDDITIRFPFAFKAAIFEYAQKHKIDSEWLFALTRQESNFNTLALSPVGAVGLMQLMPKTAYSIDNQHPGDLSAPHTNIQLGTRYLKYLQNLVNNPILATAAYNAGLSKVKRWLPPQPCEGDIWIETIPYEETRNYVKNVLTYTCIYKTLQNKSFLLSKMMPVIDPKS